MAAKYFYVKAGLGTRTTGGGLTKQTGSFTALGAASVYAKIADALADSAPPVAGDFICLSSAHAYSQASALTYAIPAGVTVISVADTACDTYTAGASETTTGNNALAFDGGYWQGVTFTAGNSTGTAHLNIGINTNNLWTVIVGCKLRLGGSGASSRIAIGRTGTNVGARVSIKKTDCKFGSTGQGLEPHNGLINWHGGSIESGSSAITSLIATADFGSFMTMDDFDFSNAATAVNICESTITMQGQITLRNCRAPASWSGNPGTFSQPNGRVRLHNCDAGAANYRLWEKDYMGEVVEETTIVKSSGASDGTTTWSCKVTTSAYCGPTMPFYSPELAARQNTTGSGKTATVEIVHDTNVAAGQGSGTSFAFTDAELALEASYLGSSSYPLGTMIDDAVADPMATPADQASSSVTWTTTGLTTPLKQKLDVTFTPQMAGSVLGRIKATVPNKTFYADAELVIT